MASKNCPHCNTQNPTGASFCRFCGSPFSEDSKEGQGLRPNIIDCVVMTGFYTVGSTIEIMWTVENATEVYINNEPVGHLEKYDYYVEKATTIDFLVENEYGRDLRKIRIEPRPAPRINKLEVSKKRIKEGESVKITFDYSNTERAFLESNLSKEINLSCKKKVEVTPKAGERYSIVCYSKDPRVRISQDLDLQVIEAVEIENFTADHNSIIESTPIVLRWKVNNASSIFLTPGDIDLTGKDSITLHPARNIEYSLHASNELSSQTETISVCVRPLPKMEYTIPDMSKLLNLPSINLNMSMLTNNITEVNIDKWMATPLNAKKRNVFGRIVHGLINRFKGISLPSLSISIPGYDVIKKCMRIALLIVALMILVCSAIQLYICNVLWITILTIVCMLVNILYIVLVLAITKKKSIGKVDDQDLYILYSILVVSSLPSLIMFLCGADYDLYNILGEYILLEMDKLIFPVAILLFVTITYWVSIKSIIGLQQKHQNYNNIKYNIFNGK